MVSIELASAIVTVVFLLGFVVGKAVKEG